MVVLWYTIIQLTKATLCSMRPLWSKSQIHLMQAIERPITLKERALIELRNAIMLGQFTPGQRLVERAIADQLSVSRTVVRECVRHLESERLVTIVPNAGPVVTELSVAQIQEIYHLRASLEAEAVSKCAQAIHSEQGKALLILMDRIEKKLKANKVIEALEDTTNLYAMIFQIGGLEITWDLIKQLNSRINQLRLRSLSSKARQTQGPKSLRKMIDAIVKKNARGASKACREHIQQAMQAGLQQTPTRADDQG